MNQIEILSLRHANMRDEHGKPVMISVVKHQIFSWFHSTSSKALHIVASAGAVVPVLTSEQEFVQIYNQQDSTQPSSKPNLKGVK